MSVILGTTKNAPKTQSRRQSPDWKISAKHSILPEIEKTTPDALAPERRKQDEFPEIQDFMRVVACIRNNRLKRLKGFDQR